VIDLRIQTGRLSRIATAVVVLTVLSSSTLIGLAQAPAPRAPLPSEVLQQALDEVQQAVSGVRLKKWKRGTIREEAATNIDAILRDLHETLPGLLKEADAAPGAITNVLPVSKNVSELYDVLVHVVEASRIAGTADQANQLQQALNDLEKTRIKFGEHLQESAIAQENLLAELRSTIHSQEKSLRAAELVPLQVANSCPPPTQGTASEAKPNLRELRAKAATGNLKAEIEVGKRYALGIGTDKDYTQALSYFHKAAAGGSAEANYDLGMMYYQGLGAQPNYSQAAVYLQRAAEHNVRGATAALQQANAAAHNRSAVQQSSHTASFQQTAASEQMALRPMYVAFSFSKPGLDDFGGDGGWGAAVDTNQQAAINQAGDNCAAHSTRPDWCGIGNGGWSPVCRSAGDAKWVALAINNNDGIPADWTVGEAIGYDTLEGAARAATSNCGRRSCQVVWSQQVDCSVSSPSGGRTVSPMNSCLSLVAPGGRDIDTIAIRNTCPQKIYTIIFPLSENSESCDGGCAIYWLNIGANSTARTSKTYYWLRLSGGDVKFAACPVGYTPVGLNGQVITSGSQQFVCAAKK
jgi:TPR repeat protein